MNFGLADLAVLLIWLAICVWAVLVMVELRRIRRAVVVARAVHVSVEPSQITDAEARRIRKHIRAATNGELR